MRKPANFAEARTLRGSRTYVDQWNKVMAVVNANDIIALAIKEEDGAFYVVVASGDEYKYFVAPAKAGIGTMKKNMETLFRMYDMLEGRRDIEKIPNFSCGCPKELYVWDYLPHTKMAVMQHGGFYASESESVELYTQKAEKIICDVDKNATVLKTLHESSEFYGSRVDYPETIRRNGLTMYHMGDGMYSDDDGDNWDVF